MNFRHEKKIDIVNSSINKINAFLSSNDFVKQYPDRKVNSCYFDTINFSMFNQSEEGIIPRKKLRIRWYNNNLQDFFFEKKITLSDKRFKITKKIDFNKFQKFNNYGFFDSIYGFCSPKILVSYTRSYYKNNFFRVTIDTNISYAKFHFVPEKQKFFDKKPIMEVKYDSNLPQKYYDNLFFFKEIRFSKYSRGINFLYKNSNF